ncbi:hypothetical protein [Cryptosporangium arvum]|nr:hypothetical protein [Cryptosporangium arvum]
MDATPRLRVGEVVAVFAPLAEALAPGERAGQLAVLAVRSLLGLPAAPPTDRRAGPGPGFTAGLGSVAAAAGPGLGFAAAGLGSVAAAGTGSGPTAGPEPGFGAGPESGFSAGPEPGLPVGWPERLVAYGVPAGLVAVLAAAVAERIPTAREVAAALRETCDPIPIQLNE